jgi:hypothetical protein
MANSTVYDIRLNYILQDKVTKPARVLDAQLARTGKTADDLGKKFRRMAAGASAYFGIRAGVKHLIGFNSNMQQAKIQMGGMIQLATKMDSAASSREAIKLVDTLQQKAKTSVGTTSDMVDMASLITRPVLAAGLGMDQLATFTAKSVVAAKAFGIESGMAARDIESALMGQLRSVDRFSRALLEPLGYVGDEGRKAFNELGAAARAAKFEEALGGPAIAAMAKAQGESFSGVFSTFQDTLQMTMGEIGLPLFREVTDEIKTWNEWISKNGDRIAEMGTNIGKGLVTGFRTVKSVIGFMVDHADLLLTVAKVWAGVKVGQKLGGMADSFGEVAGRITRRAAALQFGAGMDKAGLATANFGIKLTGAVRSFATFLPAIGAATAGLYGIWEWWTKSEREKAALKRREKQKALEVAAPFDPASVMKMATRALPGLTTTRDEIARLADLQGERLANAFNNDAAPTGEELAIAESLRGQASEMKEFYRTAAIAAQKTGMIPEYGTPIQAARMDAMAKAVRENLGIAPGVKGLAGQEAESKIYTGLMELKREIQYMTPSVARETLATMMRGEYLPSALATALQSAPVEPKLDGRTGKKPEFKVTIQRIEVQSDDPARFVVGLTETVRDAVRNRSAAYDTLLEGR